jgi:hypothetical protein
MKTEQAGTSYQCVDPAVGAEIWQLDSPALDADLRRKLQAHVSICHACRLDRDLDVHARRLVRDGEIETDVAAPAASAASGVARVAGYAAALALAASLAGALFLPPRPIGADIAIRGDGEARFTRPIEGEVVTTDGCRLGWTEVPGATSYEVRITDREGTFAWTGESTEPHLDLPDDISLEDGAGYRALLSTQPADLLPPGRTSVAFEAGSLLDAARHRMRWARQWVYGVGFGGLAMLGLALVRRRS